MIVDITTANTTILRDNTLNMFLFTKTEIANKRHAPGTKILNAKYPKTVNKDFSNTNAHTTINKYEPMSII